MDIISSNEIEGTKAFQSLDKSIQMVYLKRANRETINNALIVYKNTGQINNGLGHKMLLIINELIIKRKYNEKK
jgi:hypothetical protein